MHPSSEKTPFVCLQVLNLSLSIAPLRSIGRVVLRDQTTELHYSALMEVHKVCRQLNDLSSWRNSFYSNLKFSFCLGKQIKVQMKNISYKNIQLYLGGFGNRYWIKVATVRQYSSIWRAFCLYSVYRTAATGRCRVRVQPCWRFLLVCQEIKTSLHIQQKLSRSLHKILVKSLKFSLLQ